MQNLIKYIAYTISIFLLLFFILSFLLNEIEATKLWSSLTDIGDERFFIFISVIIYYFYEKLGIYLITLILLSGLINIDLKWIVNSPRPPEMKIPETGPGFPSNHAQSTTTFWSFISLRFRHFQIFFLSIIYIAFVAYSRLYLSVHYPIDVIGGIIIGLIISYGFFNINFKKQNFLIIYLIIIIVSFLTYFIFYDDNLLKTGSFILGFSLNSVFKNEAELSRMRAFIAFIVWASFALPMLFLKLLPLILQYFALGASVPLIKRAFSILKK